MCYKFNFYEWNFFLYLLSSSWPTPTRKTHISRVEWATSEYWAEICGPGSAHQENESRVTFQPKRIYSPDLLSRDRRSRSFLLFSQPLCSRSLFFFMNFMQCASYLSLSLRLSAPKQKSFGRWRGEEDSTVRNFCLQQNPSVHRWLRRKRLQILVTVAWIVFTP